MASERTYSIGIDLGGTKIAAGLCSNGEILVKCIIPTPVQEGADGIFKAMHAAVSEVLGESGQKPITGIGIGAAGQIDPETGAVIYAPNLNWRNVPLAAELSQRTGYPVKVLNDVRAATLAEFKFGAGKGLEHFVNIFVGTGIGSGIVMHGTLVNGASNSAGEIGHTCLDPEGPVCGCGKKGCFEAYASGKGLENRIKDHLRAGQKSMISELVHGDVEKVTGPVIGTAAKAGDELALSALCSVGKYLGLALANVHTFLNPQTILLGGGMMALKEFYFPAMEKTLQEIVLPVAAGRRLYELAKFENDAVLLGGSAIFS
jgi:glucokinase